MIEIIKEFYIFALLLVVFSYLVPKEEYKAYIQFFIGIFLFVVILRPVLNLVNTEDISAFYDIFQEFNAKMKDVGEGYEIIIFEGKGE